MPRSRWRELQPLTRRPVNPRPPKRQPSNPRPSSPEPPSPEPPSPQPPLPAAVEPRAVEPTAVEPRAVGPTALEPTAGSPTRTPPASSPAPSAGPEATSPPQPRRRIRMSRRSRITRSAHRLRYPRIPRCRLLPNRWWVRLPQPLGRMRQRPTRRRRWRSFQLGRPPRLPLSAESSQAARDSAAEPRTAHQPPGVSEPEPQATPASDEGPDVSTSGGLVVTVPVEPDQRAESGWTREAPRPAAGHRTRRRAPRRPGVLRRQRPRRRLAMAPPPPRSWTRSPDCGVTLHSRRACCETRAPEDSKPRL